MSPENRFPSSSVPLLLEVPGTYSGAQPMRFAHFGCRLGPGRSAASSVGS